ncbi:hypothetical protein ACRBEV_05935 [Methylobacterium phyllosphaerae]
MTDTAVLPGGLVAAIRPLDPGAPWIPAWRALGAAALIRNPFYEAGYALAARDAFGAGVRLLLVADRAPEAPGVQLVAAWPFRLSWRRWGLPLPLLMGWTHGYAPSARRSSTAPRRRLPWRGSSTPRAPSACRRASSCRTPPPTAPCRIS